MTRVILVHRCHGSQDSGIDMFCMRSSAALLSAQTVLLERRRRQGAGGAAGGEAYQRNDGEPHVCAVGAELARPAPPGAKFALLLAETALGPTLHTRVATCEIARSGCVCSAPAVCTAASDGEASATLRDLDQPKLPSRSQLVVLRLLSRCARSTSGPMCTDGRCARGRSSAPSSSCGRRATRRTRRCG